MRATPLTYEHEPRRVFWVVCDLRPYPRYFQGIEIALRAHWRTLPCTDRSAVGMGVDFSVARARYARVLQVPSSRTTWSASAMDDFLAGQPLSSAPSSPPRAPDGAARACAISHVPRRHGGRRGTGVRDGDVARGRRVRSCVRTRARSRAARRALPSPWTTACGRRSDSPRRPGTVPVSSDVPHATFCTLV